MPSPEYNLIRHNLHGKSPYFGEA
jgi:hypothetical protein